MAEPNRDSGSQDMIDDALRLVDALQRKLIIAGVRKGVSAATSPPPRKGDVWEEAIRQEQPEPERPPLEQFFGIVRAKGPEVAGHLGRAGFAFVGAVGETIGVVERALQRSGSGTPPQAGGGDRELPRGGTGN
ncbi:hypothetical protein ACFO4E_06655 [Nocardiopsis mangrovi]|uniref:Uncharacterized protein n=1 Tax=Nocardiopsis mangrovi TaxID=1179818 RepID=A0ABV9DS54_9ACTN